MNFYLTILTFSCNSEKKSLNCEYQLATVSKKVTVTYLYFFHGWNKKELWHVNCKKTWERKKVWILRYSKVSELWNKKAFLFYFHSGKRIPYLFRTIYKWMQKDTWTMIAFSESECFSPNSSASRLWKQCRRPLPGQKTYSIYIVSTLLAGKERLYKQAWIGSGCQ